MPQLAWVLLGYLLQNGPISSRQFNLGRPPDKDWRDLMAAGNFNLQLPIAGSGFIEWPAGPLFPAVGEMMLRVEV
jgi:hypothetical protein